MIRILLVFVLSFVVGSIWFLIQYDYIVFQYSQNTYCYSQQNINKEKKNLYFFKNDEWHIDTVDMLWEKDAVQSNIMNLLQYFIHCINEENIINSLSLEIQSVLFDNKMNVIYISFNASPLSSHWSIKQKIVLLKGIHKTVDNACKDKDLKIKWLVHHQPIEDMHLDFVQPWSN